MRIRLGEEATLLRIVDQRAIFSDKMLIFYSFTVVLSKPLEIHDCSQA